MNYSTVYWREILYTKIRDLCCILSAEQRGGKSPSYLIDMAETRKTRLKKDLSKRFLLGIMDIMILHLLRKKPMRGYDIIDKIKKHFGVKISPGTIYPILSKLKKQRLISAKKHGRKTLFCSTKNGKIVRRLLIPHYLKVQKNIAGMFRRKNKT